MKIRFAASIAFALSAFSVPAFADSSLMQQYEQIRNETSARTSVMDEKGTKSEDLMKLVSYKVGDVSISPLMNRNKDGNRLPKLGITLTVPLGGKGA